MLDPALVTLARLGIGCLLVYAATHKLRDMLEFRLSLGAYELIPEALVRPSAYALPIVELLLGVACLAQVPLSYLGALALFSVYTLAIGINLARGRDTIDCGCGGPPQPLSYALVVRNGLLLLACGIASSSTAARPLGWLDGITIALGVGVLALLYASANLLLVARARTARI